MKEYLIISLYFLRIFLVIFLSLLGKQPYSGISMFFLLLSLFITTDVEKPQPYFIHILEVSAIVFACLSVIL